MKRNYSTKLLSRFETNRSIRLRCQQRQIVFGRESRLPRRRVVSRLSPRQSIGLRAVNDFQSLIPAYLCHNLSEARSLLLVDHTHECIPCRKAMNEARKQRHGIHVTPGQRQNVTRLQPVVLRWGIAAASGDWLWTCSPYRLFNATCRSARASKLLCRQLKVRFIRLPTRKRLRLALAQNCRLMSASEPRKMRMRLSVSVMGHLIEMKDRSELYLTQERDRERRSI